MEWRPLKGRLPASSSWAARGDEQAHPDAHGHVVVVVSTPAGQPLAHDKYPFAYWGRLGGGGMRNQTVNWAWREEDRDNVTYAAHDNSAAGDIALRR